MKPTQTITGVLEECLPRCGVIREYVAWACGLTHTPPENHLASILPAVATETLRRGWTTEGQIHNIWCALVAGPAIGKTTALGLAQDFVKDWLKEAQGPLYQDPFVAFEGSIPGVIHVLKERGTPEGSFATLYHSEFARVLRHEDALDLLCLLYDNRDIERNLRKDQDAAKDEGGAPVKQLEKPRLSAVVTMTHGSLEEVFRESMLSGGLGSRLLWFTSSITPEKLMHRQRTDPDGRAQLLAAWRRWSGTLDALAFQAQSMSNGAQLSVGVSDAADQALVELFDSLRVTIVEDNGMSGIAQRAANYAERIAGIYALTQGQLEVDEDTARRAIRLVKWSLESVGMLRPILRTNLDQRLSERLYLAISKSGSRGMTRTELVKAVQLPKAQIDIALEILTSSERITDHHTMPLSGRGRHVTRYYAAEHAPLLTSTAPVVTPN